MKREGRNAYFKAYYETHKDERKAYFKAYNETHKDERRTYRETHKDEKKAYSRAYNETHKDEIRAYLKAHQKKISNNLTDAYIKKLMKQHLNLSLEEISQHPEWISKYRELIEIVRLKSRVNTFINKNKNKTT